MKRRDGLRIEPAPNFFFFSLKLQLALHMRTWVEAVRGSVLEAVSFVVEQCRLGIKIPDLEIAVARVVCGGPSFYCTRTEASRPSVRLRCTPLDSIHSQG